ncbi:MAG: UDP-3-O-(3-hydroxymyristoyl)glucosamine N-acyltransferase [Pigmentiphaga sp.]
MPVLLDPAAAWPLDVLLKQVETDGLAWELEGGPMPRVAGLGTLTAAGPLEISFLSSARYGAQLRQTRAGAVVVAPDVAQALHEGAQASIQPSFIRIVTAQPYLLFARLAQWFDRQRQGGLNPGVHPTARVAPDARLGDDVSIGPQVVIEAGVEVGAGARIGAGCAIGAGSRIGAGTLLYPRAVLYHGVVLGERVIVHSGAVIGADGFGFAPDAMAAARGEAGRWVKIPQLGGVRIGNDVEIGANTTIDRGALDDTVIEDGVKLDDQIMVAHNVHIGAHTAIAACVGIAGSTRIGARCMIGGAAMIGGHLSIPDDTQISAATPVPFTIDKPGRYTGLYPLAEHADWQRNAAVIGQLGALRRRLRSLERRTVAEGAAGAE